MPSSVVVRWSTQRGPGLGFVAAGLCGHLVLIDLDGCRTRCRFGQDPPAFAEVMTVWFQTADPDPIDAVSSVVRGYRYHCPDIETVDLHIAELRAQIGPESNFVESRKALWRRDIDLLLDRRLYLAAVDTAVA